MPAQTTIQPGGDLKSRISAEGVAWLAGELARAQPRFPRRRFIATATEGLEQLELKQRVEQVSLAIEAALPEPFDQAASVLDRALDNPDFRGWMVYPVNDFIGRAGLDHPERSLTLLGRSTSRWTAEYAIRAFIERHFELTYRQLHAWLESEDEHRRRLVSEGTRPRLPWGRRLRGLVANPRPSLPLLERLVGDPSAYVRRSVANHLNDISRDHPQLALGTAAGWLGGDGDAELQARRQWVVRHGLRTLVKLGDPGTLALLGFDPQAAVEIDDLRLSPERLPIGATLTIDLELRASAGATAAPSKARAGRADAGIPVMIDYVIHFQGAGGPRAPKVFKWATRTLIPDEPLRLTRRHHLRHASVRRLYPGPHRIEIQVNGRRLADGVVELHEAG